MTSSKNTNVTPADVAAKAAEEKLVTTVPAQGNSDEAKTGDQEGNITTGETNQKSAFAQRLSSLTEKLKANKKVVIAVGAAVGVSTLAFVKYAKAKAELTTVEELSDDENTADETAV